MIESTTTEFAVFAAYLPIWMHLVILGVLIVGALIARLLMATVWRDETEGEDNLAMELIAEDWKQHCETNRQSQDCRCSVCEKYLQPGSTRQKMFRSAWADAEKTYMKALQHYDYKPDSGRAWRFAQELDDDPKCSKKIRPHVDQSGVG